MADATGRKVLAIIPARAKDILRGSSPVELHGRPLLAHTLAPALAAKRIDRVVVTTDAPAVRDLAVSLGAQAPFLRPPALAGDGVPLDDVLRDVVERLDAEGYRPDVVLVAEPSHPFRPAGLFDQVVDTLAVQELDTVFCVVQERDAFWQLDDAGDLHRIDQHDRDTRGSRTPVFRERAGVALASRASVVRAGRRIGARVGVVAIPASWALVDTQAAHGLALAERLPASFFAEVAP